MTVECGLLTAFVPLLENGLQQRNTGKSQGKHTIKTFDALKQFERQNMAEMGVNDG